LITFRVSLHKDAHDCKTDIGIAVGVPIVQLPPFIFDVRVSNGWMQNDWEAWICRSISLVQSGGINKTTE
jgi:hypothetical protein